MPNFCVAPNCTRKSTQTDLAFFRFPRDVKRCHEWVENCRRADLLAKTPDQLNKHYRLCAAHFDPSMICKTGPFRTVLKDSAVPTIFDFNGQNKKMHKNRKRVKVLTEEEVRGIKERRLEAEAESKEDEVEDMVQDSTPQLSPKERELREYLRSLFEILLLLGKQGIPLIGHTTSLTVSTLTFRDEVAADGKQDKTEGNGNGIGSRPRPTFSPLSNFQALVEFRISSGDEALRRHFEDASTNSESCPPETLQNMLQVAGSCIREDLLQLVELYSLIAGEPVEMASDLDCESSRGSGGSILLPLFIRFVDAAAGTPREELLGFVSLEGDGEALAQRLLDYVMTTCNLDMNKCRGFAYDCGGGSGSGGAHHALKMRAAAERITERHPRVVRTLWSACSLNALLAESVGTPGTQVVVATLGRLDALLASAPALRLELERTVATTFRDEPEDKTQVLIEVCRGRWSRRHDTFQLTCDLLEPLKRCLEAGSDSGGQTPLRWSERVARDCLALAETLSDFEFLVALVVLKNVLSFTRAFGRNLQGGAGEVHLATGSVTAVLHSLVEVADNIDVYHEFWFEEAALVAQALGVPVRVPLRHLRKCASGAGGGGGAEPQPESYYKEHLTVPVVSYVISELSDLFSDAHLRALRCLALIPAVMGQLKFAADTVAEETAVAEVFRDDLPSPDTLATELQCWRVKWKHRSKGVPLPASIAETLQLADVKFFPNLDALFQALWNLPIFTLYDKQSSTQQQEEEATASTGTDEMDKEKETNSSGDASEIEAETNNSSDGSDCGSARKRLRAYLRDTPIHQRCAGLALIYSTVEARQDPDHMVEAYLKLYPDTS